MRMVRVAVFCGVSLVGLLTPPVALRAAEPADADGLSVEVGEAKAVFRKISPRSEKIDYPDFYLLETEVTNRLYREFLRATKETKDDLAIVEADRKRFQAAVDAERRKRKTDAEKRERPALPSGAVRIEFDVTEVNVRMAGRYYLDQNERMLWSKGEYADGLDEHPVAFVTLPEAGAFCDWLSRLHPELGTFRLPTWNEWMIAAYGAKRRYPWGDIWDPTYAHLGYDRGKNVDLATEAVKARPKDLTPGGLYGMLGNVAEYLDEEDSRGAEYFNLGSRWMGGDFDHVAVYYRGVVPVAPRKDYWGYRHGSEERNQGIGFRVLLDVTGDKTLLARPRIFPQIDDAWRITPQEHPGREKRPD